MRIACSAVSHAHGKKTPVVSSILNTELLAIEQHPSVTLSLIGVVKIM